MRSFALAIVILLVCNSVTYSQQKKDEKRPRLFNGGLIKRFEDLQSKIRKEREEKRKAREKEEAEKKKAEAEKKLREKQLKDFKSRNEFNRDPKSSNKSAEDSSRRNNGTGIRLPKIESSRIAPQFDPAPTKSQAKVQLGLDVKPGGIGSAGLMIDKIQPRSPAAAAGLQPKDRITSIGGSPIRKIDDLDFILGAFEPGDRTEVEFVRGGKKGKTLVEFPTETKRGTASLNAPQKINAPQDNGAEQLPTPNSVEKTARKSDVPLPQTERSIQVSPLAGNRSGQQQLNARAGIGVTAIAVDPVLFSRQNLSVRQGAYLDEISKGSAAENSGLKIGDVVIAVDGRKVDSAVGMAELIQTYQPGESAQVLYYRGNRLKRTEIVMDAIPQSRLDDLPPEVARNPNTRETQRKGSILGDLGDDFPRLKKIDDMIGRFSNKPDQSAGSSVQYNRTRREVELENEVKSLRQRLSGQDKQIEDLNQKLLMIEKLLNKNQK